MSKQRVFTPRAVPAYETEFAAAKRAAQLKQQAAAAALSEDMPEAEFDAALESIKAVFVADMAAATASYKAAFEAAQ